MRQRRVSFTTEHCSFIAGKAMDSGKFFDEVLAELIDAGRAVLRNQPEEPSAQRPGTITASKWAKPEKRHAHGWTDDEVEKHFGRRVRGASTTPKNDDAPAAVAVET